MKSGRDWLIPVLFSFSESRSNLSQVFGGMMSSRKAEASCSLLVRLANGTSLDSLLQYCNSQGKVEHYFTYYQKVALSLRSLLKEKLPQAFMQIRWMENDFRNLTAKLQANLDNQIKSYDFSKFWILVCRPLWWHSANICDVTTVQLSLWNCTQISQNFNFHENTSSLYFFTLVCWGLDDCACIYDSTLSTGLLISKKIKKLWKSILVQRQWRVVLLWYHRFWQSTI